MIFHENCLLADNSHDMSLPYYFLKLRKMSQSSAAVVIGALRVSTVGNFAFLFNCTPVGRSSDSVIVLCFVVRYFISF